MDVKAHKKLTEIAIELCKDKLPIEFSEDFKDAIVNGTDYEDSTQLCTRIKNWHFYRAKKSIIPRRVARVYGVARPSSEVIFRKRIIDLHKYSKSSKEYYVQLGRILHHIQDMSTPSHVIPIYHDPFIKDYYEKYMISKIKDSKDTLYQDLNCDSGKNFKTLYNESALLTLSYLQNTKFKAKIHKTGLSQKLPLSMFWKEYNPDIKSIPGFGTYGVLHKSFKKPKKVINGYTMIESELQNIIDYLCKKSVQDTCDALVFISKY